MRNKIFQFVWYKIVKPFITPTKEPKPFNRLRQFEIMFALSRIFGGARMIIIGDSEAGQFDNYDIMSKWNIGGIVLIFTVGGTVPYNWTDLFSSIRGEKLYKKIGSIAVQLLSQGGNCALLGKMDDAAPSLDLLKKMLPKSFMIIVPPVYYNLLTRIDPSLSAIGWKIRFDKIRLLQESIWRGRYIDTFSPFADPLGNPKLGVLEDMVHFSRECARLIERYINAVMPK